MADTGGYSSDSVNAVLWKGKELIDALQRSHDVLPVVDEKGNSDCPFGEDLYAKKKEDEEALRNHLPELHRCLQVIETELARLRHNSSTIGSGMKSLNLPEAHDKYNQADIASITAITKIAQEKHAFLGAIQLAQAVLNMSMDKKWPLGAHKEPKLRFEASSVSQGGSPVLPMPIAADIDSKSPSLRSQTRQDTILDNLIMGSPDTSKSILPIPTELLPDATLDNLIRHGPRSGIGQVREI